MKKFLLLAALALLGPVWAPALAKASGGSVSFDTNNRVSVSTSTPVLLFDANRQAKQTKIRVNPIDGTQTAATNDAILIGTSSSASDYSTSASTGTTRIHAAAGWQELGTSAEPYQGPLYGLAVSTGPLNVDRIQVQ